MPTPAREPHSRLFFALWPGDAERRRIGVLGDQLHARYGGRRVATASMHITLAFLGDTPDARIPLIEQAAAEVSADSFALRLTVAGAFGPGIFWLGPHETPVQLTELASRLHGQLRAAEVAFDEKRFVPHMTLMRKARYAGPPTPVEPIDLDFRNFVLVRSISMRTGSQYEVMKRFALRGR
jgi:2'-5' RNA ligase